MNSRVWNLSRSKPKFGVNGVDSLLPIVWMEESDNNPNSLSYVLPVSVRTLPHSYPHRGETEGLSEDIWRRTEAQVDSLNSRSSMYPSFCYGFFTLFYTFWFITRVSLTLNPRPSPYPRYHLCLADSLSYLEILLFTHFFLKNPQKSNTIF